MHALDNTQADWDLSPFFASIESEEFRAYKVSLEHGLTRALEGLESLPPLGSRSRAAWAQTLCSLEVVETRLRHLHTYLSCRGAAPADDEQVQRELAALDVAKARLEKARVVVMAGFKAAHQAEFEALLAVPELAGAQYKLSLLRERSLCTMDLELEGLAAELGVHGVRAWGRLYTQVAGRLSFVLELPGRPSRTLPVSMVRTLLEDPDRDLRTAAFRGANTAWRDVAGTIASCLNAISGTRLTLYARRGISDFLQPALQGACMSRRTLDVMLETVRARRSVAHRYLRAKAQLLGVPKLGFQDLLAPLPQAGGERLSFAQAREQLERAFAAYPKLAHFARGALRDRWVDHSPRLAKRPGAFCASSALIEQSRVFMTFNGAPGDVQTLAHELGHGFHSHVMGGMRPWARDYPMTLAETASTFAEQLAVNAALEACAEDSQRLAVLDQHLMKASTFLCNIPMRFAFESALYSRRGQGELTSHELQEMMLEAQRQEFADTVDEAQLDPFYWASKLHFYLTDISFYNFPYTFGYLFSLGILARAKAQGPDFLPRYEALLRRTGSASVEDVAAEALGVELGDGAFWNASIDLIEEDLERFLRLVPLGEPSALRPPRQAAP